MNRGRERGRADERRVEDSRERSRGSNSLGGSSLISGGAGRMKVSRIDPGGVSIGGRMNSGSRRSCGSSSRWSDGAI